AAVLFERHSLSGHPAPSRQAGEEPAKCLTRGAAQRFDSETETMIPVAHTLRGEGLDASEDGTGRGTPLVPVPFDTTQITSAANYSRPKPGDPCHPLAAGAHAPAIAFPWQLGGTMAMSHDVDLCGTLVKNQTQAVALA